MKRTFFAVLFTLCTSVAFAQDYIIVRDGTGFGAVQALPVDTGARIEAGLVGKLTGAQLNDIMTHGAEVPLDMKKRVVGWSDYYTHIVTEEGFTRVAVLDGKRIKTVEKGGVKTSKEFKSTHILGVIFLALLAYLAVFKSLGAKIDVLVWWACLVIGSLVLSSSTTIIAQASAVIAMFSYALGSTVSVPIMWVKPAGLVLSAVFMFISLSCSVVLI